MSGMPNPRVSNRRRTIFLIFLLLVSNGLAFIALVLPEYERISALQLSVGEVAPQDIVAPQTITYVSQLRTEQQQEAAASQVAPIYSPPDTSIARRQMERLRVTLTYITSVRDDSYATLQQQESDLSALEDLSLNQQTIDNILELSDSRWQAVQQESIVVLEEVMRNIIRENQLGEARRSVPSLVSLSLPEDQAEIVAELVVGFVTPNSLYNSDLTEAAREQASAAVKPVDHTFLAGETVVLRGQVITSLDLEALQALGLVQPTSRWQDFAGAASLIILATLYLLFYLWREPKLVHDIRGLTLIVSLFLVFLFTARLVLPGHTILPYIFPMTAFSLTVATLFSSEPAMVFTLPLAVLFTYNLPHALDLTLYYLMGGFFGVLALGAARRLSSFFWSAIAIIFSGTMVIVAFRLPDINTDLIGLATLIGAALLNGMASAGLTVLLQYFLAQFLGQTTALQLMEISRPDHPLLQFILRNAPGTYQHSLQVANLAEQAAERIGADALLTRVGALYHDAGKAVDPVYYIENQVTNNLNPHDALDPISSATTIINHVSLGLELAHKYHLPRQIQNFIAEHHGTMITRYQYAKALEAVGGDESQVDQEKFRYPGPRPRSRETAILMLADGCEARVRAERPKDESTLRAVVKSVIEHRMSIGQLDETDLTLRDLDNLADSFTTTLRGLYHPRLEYPKVDKVTSPKIPPTPTIPVVPQQTPDIPTQTKADA
jgi:putative nucleotidyltransferase with HDIG domain